MQELAARVMRRVPRAVAQAMTLMESDHPEHLARAQALMQQLRETHASLRRPNRALKIGVSGTPGVGTFGVVSRLAMHILALDSRFDGQDQGPESDSGWNSVCVLAVDPSSPRTHGAILGDVARMPELATHPRAFVRASASRGAYGGLAPSTADLIQVAELAGYGTILVETVGVGQSEAFVADIVDVLLLLVSFNSGDELQASKRGLLELVDMVIVNKADGDHVREASHTRHMYESALAMLSKHVYAKKRVLLSSSSVHDSAAPGYTDDNIYTPETLWPEILEMATTARKAKTTFQKDTDESEDTSHHSSLVAAFWNELAVELRRSLPSHSSTSLQQILKGAEMHVRTGDLSARSAARQAVQQILAALERIPK
ncbi:GTPase ArgK [Porphyridium purpureum]|uniref:GTPase ArgK n=1 Tax=Porphyridium purpureum TaxID=35688 RepID=A0A5J4Z0I8_PORPP|nr:GTPase ArgK [Porphyridium purpureum]|eukprot:POR3313..scf208_2